MHEIYETYERIRNERGMTNYRVAQISGVSASLICKWRSGQVGSISIENLIKIADALNVDVSELLPRRGVKNVRIA